MLIVQDIVWSGEVVRKLEIYDFMLRSIYISSHDCMVFLPFELEFIESFFDQADWVFAKEIAINWYRKRAHFLPLASWIKKYYNPEGFFYLLTLDEIESIKEYKVSEVYEEYNDIVSHIGQGKSTDIIESLKNLEERITRYQSW